MTSSSANSATGIITRRYKHGSIVYFEGDKSEYIYILKSGKVILTYLKIDTGEEEKEEIKIGEFFGVKSALGRYPREETAQTVGETVLLVLPSADFERLILKKVDVVMKMLRVFSNQLRRIGRMQREVLGETDTINPTVELFKIGEYYFRIGKLQQALYSYKRYMEHFPDTEHSSISMKRIKEIESGDVDLDNQNELIMDETDKEEDREEDLDLTDFTIEEESSFESEIGAVFDPPDKSDSSVSSNVDDFFSMEESGDIDKLTFDEPQLKKAADKGKDIAEIYYKAVNLLSQENYENALLLFKKILDVKDIKNDSERKIYEKTYLEIGKCYLKLGKYNEALNALSFLIKKFPKSDNIKSALFYIGIIFEMSNKVDNAVSYYKKVISMDPKDSISQQAMKRLKSVQNIAGKR